MLRRQKSGRLKQLVKQQEFSGLGPKEEGPTQRKSSRNLYTGLLEPFAKY